MKHKYDDVNLFNHYFEKLPIIKHLKVGTFFTGIGTPEGSLNDVGITYDLQFTSEWQIDAIIGYDAIHNGIKNLSKIKKESKEKLLSFISAVTISKDGKKPLTENQIYRLRKEVLENLVYSMKRNKNVGSITDLKGKNLPYCDRWFGGFPCQDISLAGKGKGFSIESESRSSLGWEMICLLKEVKQKPKYIIFENVAAITFQTHAPILKLFKDDLKELGYSVYDQLLNAKDYGSPQNRNRYFLIAILGEYSYKFPKPIKLELRLKDLLDDEVNEKYYLKANQLKQLINTPHEQSSIDRVKNPKTEICNSLNTMSGGNREPKVYCGYSIGSREFKEQGWKEIMPTLAARDYKDPKVLLIPEATKKGYAEATEGDGIYLDRPHQKRGVVQKGMTPTLKTSGDDIGVVLNENDCIDHISSPKYNTKPINNISKTIEASSKLAVGLKTKNNNILTQYYKNIYVDKMDRAYLLNKDGTLSRIRKLIPLECYRLQAFKDDEFKRVSKYLSNTQLYKTSGNGINRNVLSAIYRTLYLGGKQDE